MIFSYVYFFHVLLKNQEIDQREIVGFLLYSGGVVEDHDIGILKNPEEWPRATT